MKLAIGNFKRDGAVGSFCHTFIHKLNDGGEICLEPCLAGYCVGVYDKNLDLIGEKVCTNIDGFADALIAPGFSVMTGEALQQAVSIANTLIK